MTFISHFFKKHNLRPFMTTYLATVHLAALIGVVQSIVHSQNSLKVVGLVIGISLVYGLGISAGCHRLWAHKSYQASWPLRFFLMLLNAGANQGTIYHWSRDHRLHHKFSDTLSDPYSIERGFFFAHMGWLLHKKPVEVVREGEKINMKDLEGDWVITLQRKYNPLFVVLMCWTIPGYLFHLVTGSGVLMSFCLANMPYVFELHATWCVNSICHKYGTRPWNKNIAPADNLFVSFITNGQGYHNWHHEYPSDWRGCKDHWYMLNVTARFLQLCSFLGLVKLKAPN